MGGINWAGVASGYEGANAALDNQALQSRLAAQEARAEQDQDFVQYQRNIAIDNRTKNLADLADIKAKADAQNQSAPSQQSASAAAAAPSAPNQVNAPDTSANSPQPLVRAGGLKSSPVNVVSPQSADGATQPADSSGQSQATGASGASDTAPVLNEDGSINNDALANLGVTAGATQSPTATADGSNAPATTVAVPAPNSPTASQTPLDNSGSVPAAPTNAAAPGPMTNASAQSSQSASTANQPLVTQPVGVPQPRNFNSILDQQLELLNRQVSDGRVSPQEYAANVKNINAMKQEGVHEALDLMAQGQYQEAMDKFNSVGVRRGVQFVSAKDGTTMVDGVEQPTKLVTLRAPDGSTSVTDVTQARYQLMNIDQQLTHADKAANTAMLAGYHGKMGDYYAQQAKTQEQWRADQASNFRMQRQEEQEKIDALKNGQQAPIWDDKARARLDKLYTQTDPTTGTPAYDPTGAIFAKQVGLARSRTNGGDVEGALDFAYQTDLGLKQAAGSDPAKLAQLRAGYLNSIAPKGASAPQAPASAPSSASGSATQGSAATTLSGNDPNGPADTDHQG